MTGSASRTHPVAGVSRPGFEAVRKDFVENFQHRHELGGLLRLPPRGEDGRPPGRRPGPRRRAVEADHGLVHSTTQGMAGITLAPPTRGGPRLDGREPLLADRPAGQERITSRQLLSYQAGLFELGRAAGEKSRRRSRPAGARASPARSRVGRLGRGGLYAITFGSTGRDPEGRSQASDLGRLQDRIATPLGLDFYVRLPEETPDPGSRRFHRPGTWRTSSSRSAPARARGHEPRLPLRRPLLGSSCRSRTTAYAGTRRNRPGERGRHARSPGRRRVRVRREGLG